MHLSSVASLTQKLREATPGRTVTSPSRLGDIAEHWVAMLAAWKGAEVYPNLNCTGPTDFIMVVDGVPYQLDVKLARPQLPWFLERQHRQGRRPCHPCPGYPPGRHHRLEGSVDPQPVSERAGELLEQIRYPLYT